MKKDEVEIVPFEREHCTQLTLWANDISGDRLPAFSKRKLSTDGLLEASKRPNSFLYAIYADKKHLVGFARIFDIDMVHRKARLYVFVDPKIKGFAALEYKANILICEHCFGITGLNKLSADIPYGNVYLLKLYDKIGFRRDVLKRQHSFVNGAYQHTVEVSLLCSDIGYRNGNQTNPN